MLLIKFYALISLVCGITFGFKLMERAEDQAQRQYKAFYEGDPILKEIIDGEERHEKELIEMIDEEKLNYMGSIVLGLNDALVELTGALAGYTFAFQNAKMIALTGLITGIAYVLTVGLLILPYLIISNLYISLGVSFISFMIGVIAKTVFGFEL